MRRTTRLYASVLTAAVGIVAWSAAGAAGTTVPDDTAPASLPEFADETVRISAIPDQDPEEPARRYGIVSDYLAQELGVTVEYVPVVD
ncbi:hypothetical protein BH24ACT5_BH24ACT5_32170 [soil metagenome]